MAETAQREGRCHCGAIGFRVAGVPLRAGICHCRLCRLALGAPMMAGAVFPREAVTMLSGEARRFRSSERGTRHFCGACGTKLFFSADDVPDVIEVVGGLDPADQDPPAYDIWTEAKLSWVTLDMAIAHHSRGRADGRDWAPPPPRPASPDPRRHGGCLCGDVVFRIDADPASRCFCHCEDCRRTAGAPVMAWGTVPSDAYHTLSGAPARYASSARGERRFCGRCGTTLTYRSRPLPGEVDVALATLDDPSPWSPTAHVFAGERLPWLRLSPDLPERTADLG